MNQSSVQKVFRSSCVNVSDHTNIIFFFVPSFNMFVLFLWMIMSLTIHLSTGIVGTFILLLLVKIFCGHEIDGYQ